MANSTSLKGIIDKLINDLGATPKPGPIDIRNRLMRFSHLAEALESGQSAIEAEQKIAVLESTVQELESKLRNADAQEEKTQAALDAAREQIRAIQKQEEENEPLSSIESRVLYVLDGRGDLYEPQIAREMDMAMGDADGILGELAEAGFLKSKEDTIAPKYFLTKKAKAWIARDRASRL